jgi:preprotein translocase subunit SecE
MTIFINYLKDTVAELKHVSWPTQRQTLVYTALVVAISIFMAVFTGLFDFVFSKGLDWFLK